MNRAIRFKEWGCLQNKFKRPSDKQISVATSGLEEKDYSLNTDINGFIINSQLPDRNKRDKSIVLLGDSFVESLFVDEDKRINAIIERMAPSFNVLNGGYSGATSLHILNVLINKVIPLLPNYVVVFIPTNDQRIQALENGYWNKDKRLSPLVPLGKEINVESCYNDNSLLNSVDKILKSISFMLNNYHIPHCFVTTPHRSVVDDDDEWLNKVGKKPEHYNTKIKQRKLINISCRKFCKKYSIDFIDLESTISNGYLFYDDLHLTN